MFAGKIPEGTIHIDLPVAKLCKKNNIEYLDAVVGMIFKMFVKHILIYFI